MALRRLFDLGAELDALRRLADEERLRVNEAPLMDLSPEHERQLREFQLLSLEEANLRHKDLAKEVLMQLTLLGIRERAKDPYRYSDLSEWLGFETWKPKDALLLLAGVSPSAAIVDWTYENFMGAVVDRPRIRAASDLNAIYDDYDLPERSSWSDDIARIKKKLRAKDEPISEAERSELTQQLASLEKLRDGPELIRRESELRHRSHILGVLSSQWFSGDHDAERRHSPEHFIGWAGARGFRPEWYEWAKTNGLIDASETIFSAELFNPDAEDYPELLHIAVRAWEFARSGTAGTPKQRIQAFLSDRYPKLPATTREFIAQVANWQRTGGRPKT